MRTDRQYNRTPCCGVTGITPPSSLRDATSPSRGGLGKEGELYAMPKAPLLAGAVAAGDWGVQPLEEVLGCQ